MVDTVKTGYGGCVLNCTHVSDTGVSNGAHWLVAFYFQAILTMNYKMVMVMDYKNLFNRTV